MHRQISYKCKPYKALLVNNSLSTINYETKKKSEDNKVILKVIFLLTLQQSK
jgi:hypothetical protein